VKIRTLAVKGFRGFNEERTIDFHENLTLICAPNSYGKTSISEALEWLLYGITSKVQMADSVDEYKGSYRNRHFPESERPTVTAKFIEGRVEVEFRGELTGEDTIKRFVDGREVQTWPLGQDLLTICRPFVLQHALKYLLLVKPDDRFQGFARLLGLVELDQIQKNVVSLCTKPGAAIPNEVDQLLKKTDAFIAVLETRPSLADVSKVLKKGPQSLADVYKVIAKECMRRLPVGTEERSFSPELLKIREDAVSKIFKGRITLFDYSEDDKHSNADDEKLFSEFCTEAFVRKYMDLVALATVQRVLKRAQFFELGVDFLNETPSTCPFCGTSVDDTLAQHVREVHANLSEDEKRSEVLQNQRAELTESLSDLTKRLELCQERHDSKVASFLGLEPSMGKLERILAPKYPTRFQALKTALSQIEPASKRLQATYGKVRDILKAVDDSIRGSNEDTRLAQSLAESLIGYVKECRLFGQVVSFNVPSVSEADQILKRELDSLAGTEDISMLVELLESHGRLKKYFEIHRILDSLKDLRKAIDKYVGARVLGAVSGELTKDVMQWYGLIRTTGDPDVHFAGFDIERTKTGELKSRRIQVKAVSYGVDLVSAVSSLSESKLNALGLCVSIATNLKGESPFDFLIIDDPIQSWDAEHEVQFIQVIRKLAECGKQVILLSHNRKWLDQVCAGCRTMNGWYYEITGYTQAGPHVSEIPWEMWKKRLDEVDAIVKDPGASSVKLQQAEQEIRIAICQIASELYLKEKNDHKSPHGLNSAKVRRILVECGVSSDLTDRIVQTFQTTDPAHHPGSDYVPQRERIRQYHSWVHELASLLT
jgi:hypothetical protein